MEIKLQSRGSEFTVIVDDDCSKEILNTKMFVLWSKDHTYPYVQLRGGKLLHRVIMGAEAGERVDHINRNGLDNRRLNLRIVSAEENSWNRKKHADNTSGFIGVTRIPGDKFVAVISSKCKTINIGRFKTAEEAAHAYDAKCRELRGKFAVTNFPP